MDIKDKKYKRAIKGIHSLISDLKKYGVMIASLLEVSRIKQEDNKIKRFKVRQSIDAIIEDYQKYIDKNEMKIEVQVDKDLVIKLPIEHFEIIFSNLLSNAIKYGNNKSRIQVSILKKGNKGKLTMVNEVDEVKKLDIKKIWLRFYRGSNNKNTNGHGVGLSVVREVAKINKLTIANSLTNKGQFVVEIDGLVIE